MMRGRLTKICGLFCLICFFLALPGCEKKPEAPKKPKVVSKKIVRGKKAPPPTKPAKEVEEKTDDKAPKTAVAVKKDAEKTKPAESMKPTESVESKGATPDGKSDVVRQTIPPRDKPLASRKREGETAEAPGEAPKEVPGKVSGKVSGKVPGKVSGVDEPGKKMDEPDKRVKRVKRRKKAFSPKSDIAMITKKTPGKGALKPGAPGKSLMPSGYKYEPKGKIDPFKPIFRGETASKSPTQKKRLRRKVHIPKTPLEKISISQLKLTAVISAPSGNRALVEEATGKGYVIKIGTGIGTRWGKVVEIKEDRVIIEEEIQDAFGNWTKRKKEIKLQKPTGD